MATFYSIRICSSNNDLVSTLKGIRNLNCFTILGQIQAGSGSGSGSDAKLSGSATLIITYGNFFFVNKRK